MFTLYEILDSHGGEDVDAGLLCSNALNMEAVRSSETLVSTYKFIRHYYPEDQHRNIHNSL
jgi:hypothetical protein